MIQKKLLIKVLSIFVTFLYGTSLTMAQNVTDNVSPMDIALNAYILSHGDEKQKEEIINAYRGCSKSQQDKIRTNIVKTITDLLNVNNTKGALSYIEYYKSIADPKDEYLGSLVMIQGKHYYDSMDTLKLSELEAFMKATSMESTLDYSNEISELQRMKNEVIHGCEAFIGYWVADFSEKKKADPFYIQIYIKGGKYGVTTEYNTNIYAFNTDLCRYSNEPHSYYFHFSGNQTSTECVPTAPATLSYYWTSDKLNIGKEDLAAVLRGGARSISNSIIGEMARTNTHSLTTSLLGSTGAIVGEALLNTLIDNIAVSKKTIRIITGQLTLIDANNISASFVLDYYKMGTGNSDMKEEHRQFNVKLVRCQWNSDDIKKNIAFIDCEKKLRQDVPLSKEKRKEYCKRDPKARKIIRKMPLFIKNKTLRQYNREQLLKLKEYNKTH